MSQHKTIYDIIGIGIGPFNLGMAALAASIPELNCLFIDQNPEFNWHLGMMLDNARLQVPFYADLVTLADPRNQFSFLSFLKAKQRMFRFAILENYFITRKEYNDYCRWVANQLTCLQFGLRCEAIRYDDTEKVYAIYVRDVSSQVEAVYYCKQLVLGVGSIPYVPDNLTLNPSPVGEGLSSVGCSRSLATARDDNHLIFHSSDYLYFKERLLTKKAVTIVGSGQSAAEIFSDLLSHSTQFSKGLNWFTRNHEFYPMDYSSFSLEKTSPEYIDHFYRLSPAKKKERLATQDHLYKGINFSLIQEIYCELYQLGLNNDTNHIGLYSNSELQRLTKTGNDEIELSFYHSESEQSFTHNAEAVILATGYKQQVPEFAEPIKDLIKWTPDPSTGTGQVQYKVKRNYSIDAANSIFVQNAELHTHGFNAPDLGMGPYRNSIILNAILGYEHFVMEKNISFQTFGVPAQAPS